METVPSIQELAAIEKMALRTGSFDSLNYEELKNCFNFLESHVNDKTADLETQELLQRILVAMIPYTQASVTASTGYLVLGISGTTYLTATGAAVSTAVLPVVGALVAIPITNALLNDPVGCREAGFRTGRFLRKVLDPREWFKKEGD